MSVFLCCNIYLSGEINKSKSSLIGFSLRDFSLGLLTKNYCLCGLKFVVSIFQIDIQTQNLCLS